MSIQSIMSTLGTPTRAGERPSIAAITNQRFGVMTFEEFAKSLGYDLVSLNLYGDTESLRFLREQYAQYMQMSQSNIQQSRMNAMKGGS